MLAIIPLMIIPLALYNLIAWGWLGSITLQSQVLEISMMSGAAWSMSVGDLLIVIALGVLFIEILKSTRRSGLSVVDHMLSFVLFIVFLVEFLLVGTAATQVFFILMVIAFVDVAAGFSVSIRSASRDVSIGL